MSAQSTGYDSTNHRVLAAAIRANVPVLMWGDPGIGKTATVEKLAASWGYHLETVVGSIREPTDFLGLPIQGADGQMTYSAPDWALRLNEAEKSILFLDELTTCAPSVQKAMLRIIQERVVGTVRLGEHVVIIAAANPPEIAADGYDLSLPMSSRVAHLSWTFDRSAWLTGRRNGFSDPAPAIEDIIGRFDQANVARAGGMVDGFLTHRPDFAHQVPTDPEKMNFGWPTGRTWDKVVALLANLRPDDDEAMFTAVASCVGEAAAIEFTSWLATADLYDPIEVLDNPSVVDWANNRPDRLFALMSSVTTVVLDQGTRDAWNKGMAVVVAGAQAGLPDVVWPTAQQLARHAPEGAKLPASFRAAFRDLMVLTGKWADEGVA